MREIVPPEWTISTDSSDYGVDYRIQVFQNAVPTPHFFAVQMKARTRGYPGLRLSRKTLNFLMMQPMPSMIILFNPTLKEGRAIWLEDLLDLIESAPGVKQHPDAVSFRMPESSVITAAWPQNTVERLRKHEASRVRAMHDAATTSLALKLTTSTARIRHHLANLFPMYVQEQYKDFSEYWVEWRSDVFAQLHVLDGACCTEGR
jgi:hypothetical protein